MVRVELTSASDASVSLFTSCDVAALGRSVTRIYAGVPARTSTNPGLCLRSNSLPRTPLISSVSGLTACVLSPSVTITVSRPWPLRSAPVTPIAELAKRPNAFAQPPSIFLRLPFNPTAPSPQSPSPPSFISFPVSGSMKPIKLTYARSRSLPFVLPTKVVPLFINQPSPFMSRVSSRRTNAPVRRV